MSNLGNVQQKLKLHGGVDADGASPAFVVVAAGRISRNASTLIMQCCPCTRGTCSCCVTVWEKVCSTKKVNRFHPPQVKKALQVCGCFLTVPLIGFFGLYPSWASDRHPSARDQPGSHTPQHAAPTGRGSDAIRKHQSNTFALQVLEVAKEHLTAAADTAWLAFLAEFAQDYIPFRAAVQALGALDALQSLAVVANNTGWAA